MRHYKLKTTATRAGYEYSCKYSINKIPSTHDWVEKGQTTPERSEHYSKVTCNDGKYSFEPRLPWESDERLVSLAFQGQRLLLDRASLVMRIKSEFVVH